MTFYCKGSGVIGSERKLHLIVELFEEFFKVSSAAVDILMRVKPIAYSEMPRSGGGKLHKSPCTGRRDCMGLVVRFDLNNRFDKIYIDSMSLSRFEGYRVYKEFLGLLKDRLGAIFSSALSIDEKPVFVPKGILGGLVGVPKTLDPG